MVMLFSLLTNSQTRPINLHILHELKAKEAFLLHREIMSNFVGVTHVALNRYEVSDQTIKNLWLQEYNNLPLTTFYRLLIPKLLPDTVIKCLYLDGDLIIRKDIAIVFDTDITHQRVAWVVTNMLTKYMENIQVSQYINAWVLLMNLQARRTNNVANTIIAFCANYPNGLQGTLAIMWDQCGINYVCRDHLLVLDLHYNVTPVWFRLYDYIGISWNNNPGFDMHYSQEQIKLAQEEPAILHFAWIHKPANRISYHPRKFEYYNRVFKSWLVQTSDFFKYIFHIFIYPLNYSRPFMPILKTLKKLIDSPAAQSNAFTAL